MAHRHGIVDVDRDEVGAHRERNARQPRSMRA
jgi:hypothetical protein